MTQKPIEATRLSRSEHRARRKAARKALRPHARRADLAVAYLFCRRLFPTLPIILVALTAVQTALFALALRVATPAPDSLARMASFDLLCERSGLGWTFALAFLVLTVFLCTLPDYGRARSTYTLARLGISDRRIALHHALVALGTYAALWATQLITVCALGTHYITVTSAVTPQPIGQTLYLAFLSDPFLHSLLPLHDTPRYDATVLTTATISLAVANVSLCRRRAWKPWISYIAIPTLALLFAREPDRWDMDFLCVVPLCLLFSILILRLWSKGGDSRAEEST